MSTNTMKDGKYLLQENFARDWNNGVLPITKFSLTEGKIVEAEGNEYRVQEGYEVPIWVLDSENMNGRTYTQKLGERIIQEAKKTFAMKDHPKDEGSVDKIVAVVENPHIVEANHSNNTSKDTLLCVNAFFVDDDFERKVEKILDRGMGLGVSSVGYGEVLKNGKIDEDSYELERYFDFVVDPSYQVYLTKDFNRQINEDISKTDTNTVSDDEVIEEETKDPVAPVIAESEEKEKEIMAAEKSKKLSIEEKNLRIGVKSLFEKAEKIESLDEKREAYEEVLEYCDGVDFAQEFIEQANGAIAEIDAQIKELASKGKDYDKLSESNSAVVEERDSLLEKVSTMEKQHRTDLNSLTERFDIACGLLDDMKDREEQLKEMYEISVAEKNGMVTATEYKELHYYLEKKDEEVEELRSKMRELRRRLGEKGKKKKKYEDDDEMPDVEDEEAEADDDDEDDEEDQEEKSNYKKKKKKEAVRQVEDDNDNDDDYSFNRLNPDVVDYYEDLAYQNPKMESIKDKILSCRTIFEAQRTYLKLKDLVEELEAPQRDLKDLKEVVRTNPRINRDNKVKAPGLVGSTLKNRKGWV